MTKMDDELLKIAEMFVDTVMSVQFLTKCRNIIYKAISPKRVFIIRLTEQLYRTKEQIESELDFQRYLFENHARVTEPLFTFSGESVIPLNLENEKYFVSAFSFAEGKDWSERADDSPEILFRIGKELGRIHRLSKSYRPGNFKRRMWYEQQELTDAERLFYNYNIKLYHKFLGFMDEMKKSDKDENCFGLTHGDFLMSNYLIENNDVTVIDFDECEYSW